MYHSVNRRCVLSFFTNTSCLFTKTTCQQSCHHAVFRKLGGHFCEAESATYQVRDVSQLPPNFKKLFQGESFTGLVGVPFLLANVPHLPFSQIARNRLQQFEDQFLEGKILEKQRYAPISIQKWKSESWKGNCT